METGKMKLALSAGALALSMALVGCGGGGSNSQTRAEGPATPTNPPVETEDETSSSPVTLPDGPTDLKALVAETFTIRAGGDSEAKADGDIIFSCPLGGEDCVVTVAADGVTSVGGIATAALTAEAMARLTIENQMKTASATGRGEGVFVALGSVALEGNADLVKVARPGSAAPTFTGTGFKSGDAPTSVGSDWAGATFTRARTIGAVPGTQKVTVYSDIEAPQSVSFTQVYHGTELGRIYRPAGRGVAGYLPTGATAAHATRTLTFGADLTKAEGARLDDHFPKSNGVAPVTWTYTANSAQGRLPEFKGKFHGADGTYTCPDGTCTARADADGGYTLSPGWTFVADRSSKVTLTDVDHLEFGYWVTTPSNADGTGDYKYEVELIAEGSQPFLVAEIPASTSASYSGAAAGLFAVKTVDSGEVQSANEGEFIADANLTATFGAGEGAVSNTLLEGGITNFRASDGNTVDMTNWSVALSQTALTASGSGNAVVAVPATPTTGNATAYMGDTRSSRATWTASLYGPGRNGFTDGERQSPTGVAGTFEADFTNARIAGAFGARIDQPAE